MTETEQHECETGCSRPAPSTRMCWECVDVITTALHEVLEDTHLIRVLGMIGRKEEGAFTLRTQGTTRPAYGPTEPVSLTAIAILQDLDAWDRLTAADWSQVQNPGWWLFWIPERVEQARAMVYGEEEPRVDMAAVRAKIALQNRPMPTSILIPHLANHGIRITSTQIRQWAARKKIERVDASGAGKEAWYVPTDIIGTLYPPVEHPDDTLEGIAHTCELVNATSGNL